MAASDSNGYQSPHKLFFILSLSLLSRIRENFKGFRGILGCWLVGELKVGFGREEQEMRDFECESCRLHSVQT